MEKTGKALIIVAFLLVLITAGAFNTVVALALLGIAVWAITTKADQVCQLGAFEALYLLLLNGVVRLIVNGSRDIIGQIIIWADGNPSGAFTTVYNIIDFVITVAFILLALVSLLRLIGGKPAETLLVGNYAKKTLGLFVPHPAQQTYYQSANSNTWICSDCGRQNDGQFCQGCGKKKP